MVVDSDAFEPDVLEEASASESAADDAGASPSVSIRAEIARRITFATHQCDVAVIADLAIANDTDDDLHDLTLRLTAEPKVIGDRVWNIDRIDARSEFRPRDRRVSLQGGMLDRLTEQMRAEVRLELTCGETVIAETHHPIVALARNEWGGANHMPELLAAFVTPNDPAVQRILKQASEILRSAGKNGSIDGYQSRSRKRSWELLAGIWAAVSSRSISYAEPPASFGRNGQKIRLPSMIEEQGLATCLDTALLFAAAIEQAGLFPLVVFTEGHALTGAWLQPQSLPSLTVDDPMEIRKAIALDEMVLFETTMATAGHALPFSRAIAEGRRQVAEANEHAFIYAIDIRQARGRDIQPLSSLATAGEGTGHPDPSPSAPPLDEPPDLPPFDVGNTEEPAPQSPKERLDRWQRSLLDLSKRNRLLNLRPSATAIPIFCPDPALLEDRIAANQKIRIIPPPERRGIDGQPDTQLYHLRTGEDFAEKFAREALERNEVVANLEPKVLEKGLIELYRKAKADFEEGGSNTLFLALGMLRWSERGDSHRSYRAPLILLPVRLERRSAASKPYLTSHEDESVFNLTLLQMLQQDFDISIPELEGTLPTDEHGVNVRLVWDIVRNRIRDVAGFEVVEEVILSTFSFAKYLMWKDLVDRTEMLKASPLVRHLIDSPREPYTGGARFLDPQDIDRCLAPTEILAPLNADSSQLVAIHASGLDGDFVLEGPPGTGKSETIGNIIAHNLGLGRKVLFVSEKMAALEVVYRRLSECGLGDLCLELHSAKASKRAVLDQLGAAWQQRRQMSAAEWRAKAEELGEIRSRLNGLVAALHRPGPGGLSPRDAIGRSIRFGDVHRLRLDWPRDPEGRGRAPTPEALAELEAIARRLGQQFSQLQDDDIATFASVTHTEWSYAWSADMVTAARELIAAAETLSRHQAAFAVHLGLGQRPAGSLAEAAALAEIAALVPECAAVDLGFALRPEGRETIRDLGELVQRLSAYRQAKEKLSTPCSDQRLAAAPVQAWQAARARAEARFWPLNALGRSRLRKEMRAGLDVIAEAPERDLEALATLQAQQKQILEDAGRLPAGTPWRGLETDTAVALRAALNGARLREASARLASVPGRNLPEAREMLVSALCDRREQLEPGMPVAEAARALVAAQAAFKAAWDRYAVLSGHEAEREDARTLETLVETLRAIVARERRLNVWCAWVAVRREAREAGLETLVAALEAGTVRHDQTVEAFRTAYACWIAPILIDARPELTRFSSVAHDELIRTFRELDREVAETTVAHIRALRSSEVPDRDAPNAGSGYGVLARELQKRMRHKPVRQLVAEMGPALMTLTPCLMMSPLSVAQYLPADTQPFDLVVFDEASQITVPDAIGAIARGRRCIVVGDPKQMPPTRFFERGADDSDDEEVQDLESILDEALAARVPHHRLTGHYRSRHESLICFSNHAYYNGALVTYPSVETADTAVTLRRVNGVYAKGKARTNEIEAKAVVEEVVRRLRDPKTRQLSIGVVTLNAEQQRLIEDLLDQERRADPELEPFFASTVEDGGARVAEPVFVKNLETVQGDQRDVILLSVGYGPTEPGARTMSMNFGPLNRQGGERRLNVAITRATTEVIVFASFDAGMIDLTRTSSQAVRDLKYYLDFAERGPVALGEAIRAVGTSRYDSDFELALAEELRNRGWEVRTQIGVSKFRIDLGIVHPDAPGRFLAGIECDGATYHSSPTARDRDRVRHIILEQLGWRLFRVWSTDFFLDREAAVDRLDAALRTALEADREAAAAAEADAGAPAAADEASGDARTDELDATRPESEPDGDTEVVTDDRFTWANGSPAGGGEAVAAPVPERRVARAPTVPDAPVPRLDRFYEPGYRPQLAAMAAAVIDREGPVTFKRLSDRLARAHGFQRTGRQISSVVWEVSNRLRRHERTPDGHTVFWPAGMEPVPLVPFRGLGAGSEARDWREVPYPEKLWLVRSVLDRGAADPARAVADAIGFGRVTSSFRDEIAQLAEAAKSVPDPAAAP